MKQLLLRIPANNKLQARSFFQGAGAKFCRTLVSKGTRTDKRTWCHATISSKRYTELGREIRKIKIRWRENEREIERCYSGKRLEIYESEPVRIFFISVFSHIFIKYEIYKVNVFCTNKGKCRPEKTPDSDIFYAV